MLSANKEPLQENLINRSFNKRERDGRIIKSTLSCDDEELLILSVQERRSLWDFTIPLKQ